MKVGLVQLDCAVGDIPANVQKINDYIDQYRDTVNFLVFPELSLTGYSVSDQFHKYALRLDDPLFRRVVEQTFGITVAVGFIEETPSFSFYNSLAFIRDGKILHVHRKIYLPNFDIFEEKKHFRKGPHFTCFDHEHFRVGPFVCGDAWNPALIHLASADEANLFVFSACSPDHNLGGRFPNREMWGRLNRFYAMMYGSYVMFVNRVGTERNLRFWGGSEIIDPFGRVVVRTRDDQEKVVVGKLDIVKVREARTILHTIRDEDLSFIQRRLNKVISEKDYL